MDGTFFPAIKPFLCISLEPPTFHKFIYESQKNNSTALKSHIVLNSTSTQPVLIMCDLYSQIEPQKVLSPHFLVPKNYNSMNFKPFPIYEVSAINNEFIHFTLENVHILYRPQKKMANSLIMKLRHKELWVSQRNQLTEEEERQLNAEVKYGLCNSDCKEGKVYIGFTAYIRDDISNTMKIYASIEFSRAIYDFNNSIILDPFVGNKIGGSDHTLKETVCQTHEIRIKINDGCSWEAFASEVRVKENFIIFRIPPYEGTWHDNDETRLVYITVIGCDMCSRKKSIKFLYTR